MINSYRLKAAVVAAVTLLGVASFVGRRSSAQTAAPETAGKHFKNVTVLADMPADQLGKVMNIMSASLGFNCAGCHVSGDKDFDKDTNEHKIAARKMIEMTFALNKQFFNGRPEISCNTCHNGRERPVAVPNLNPAPPVERPAQPATKPTVDQILDKYTAAIGGKEKIASIKSRTITATRVEPNGKTTESEIITQAPGKLRVETVYPTFTAVEGYDGSNAWKTGNGSPIVLRSDEAEQIRREAQVFGGGDLKAIYTKLEYRFMDRIDGRDVYLVTGTLADNTRERLYFDVATGFLVRRISAAMTVLGQFQYQVDYSDHKDFGGVKLPVTIRFAVPNISWTRKIVEVTNNAKIDPSKFVN